MVQVIKTFHHIKNSIAISLSSNAFSFTSRPYDTRDPFFEKGEQSKKRGFLSVPFSIARCTILSISLGMVAIGAINKRRIGVRNLRVVLRTQIMGRDQLIEHFLLMIIQGVFNIHQVRPCRFRLFTHVARSRTPTSQGKSPSKPLRHLPEGKGYMAKRSHMGQPPKYPLGHLPAIGLHGQAKPHGWASPCPFPKGIGKDSASAYKPPPMGSSRPLRHLGPL